MKDRVTTTMGGHLCPQNQQFAEEKTKHGIFFFVITDIIYGNNNGNDHKNPNSDDNDNISDVDDDNLQNRNIDNDNDKKNDIANNNNTKSNGKGNRYNELDHCRGNMTLHKSIIEIIVVKSHHFIILLISRSSIIDS